jgi:deoxyribodipyrimidine photolyase-related protein
MMRAALIYPHQLYHRHPALQDAQQVYLVEDPLLFRQYAFHCHKLILHRASMQHYAEDLRKAGRSVVHVQTEQLARSADIAGVMAADGVRHVQYCQLNDDWLQRRLTAGLQQHGLTAAELNGPDFLTPSAVFDELAQRKQKWFFTDFYLLQRKRLKILIDDNDKPEGGKWSFDPENRSRLPKDCHVPQISWPQPAGASSEILAAARRWVTSEFPGAPGNPDDFHYPITRRQALTTLQDFLQQRFEHFGLYEDAIHDQQTFLFHSVLTPALNIGLLSPAEIVESALQYADHVPLNSLEGFLRQVIGWREYMRGVYRHFGRRQRTTNYWGHQRALPSSFYDGTTGIQPVDTVIRRVQQHAWCHHIERLMILGSFMLLCEFSPDAVYQWFMELFIDAYDWVMVPNVYGMSQYADGGLITTKPYICGSAYVLKMSNFRKGPWCPIWDALYWRFINRHSQMFAKNPRMSMMVRQCEKMGPKLDVHLQTAERFLNSLH